MADAVIFPCEQDVPTGLQCTLIAELPRWIGDENKLTERLRYLKNNGISLAFCGNLSAVEIAKECGLTPVGDIGLNIYNGESVKCGKQLGLVATVLSAECTTREAAEIPPAIPTGLFAYGRLPLMLLRNCPLKNGHNCHKCDRHGYLTDRLGKQFPVRCRGDYSELFNSAPVYLADRLKEISCVDFLLLSFTDESPQQVLDVLKAYSEELPPIGEFTRGLAFRPSL